MRLLQIIKNKLILLFIKSANIQQIKSLPRAELRKLFTLLDIPYRKISKKGLAKILFNYYHGK